jgi:hypothetical protein
LPPLPLRTSSAPRAGSRSRSARQRPSEIRSPARQRTTISPRSRTPWIPGLPHDRDDLFDAGRIGRVADPLVSGWASGVVSRHGRG